MTPTSSSILPSCTKAVLLQQARDMGITVEERPVPFDEVPTFREVAACGTAVVVTPIQSITRGSEVIRFEGYATLEKLYNAVTAVQNGEADDPHGYTRVVCERPHESV